jgi:hypothetical protein
MREYFKRPFSCPTLCLVCGVDSKPVLSFFLWLIGFGLLASFCVFVWGYASGKFSSEEQVSQIPLKAESISASEQSGYN